ERTHSRSRCEIEGSSSGSVGCARLLPPLSHTLQAAEQVVRAPAGNRAVSTRGFARAPTRTVSFASASGLRRIHTRRSSTPAVARAVACAAITPAVCAASHHRVDGDLRVALLQLRLGDRL